MTKMYIGRTATSTITLPMREMEYQTENRSKCKPMNYRNVVINNQHPVDVPNIQKECHLEKCHHLLFLLIIYVGNIFLNCGRKLVHFVKVFFQICFVRGELPKLYYKSSAIHEFLIKNCKNLTSEYRYSSWAFSGWINTLSNIALTFWCQEATYIREFLVAEDGGIIAIDWLSNGSNSRDRRAPIVLVIPCANVLALSEDIICAHAYREGFIPVVFRKRGSAGIPLTSSSKYQTFGQCSDLREVVTFVQKLDPKRKLISIGVGTGASLLLSYLGEYGSSCYLQAAVCLSPWYSLESQLSVQNKTLSQWIFLQSLKLELLQSAGYLHNKIDLDQAFGSSSTEDYIRNVLSLNNNSSNLEEFYENNEPLREIDEIAIPLLCINSLDDPVVQENHIPFDLFETVPHVTLATTRRGGHCSYLHGWRAENWALNLATDYCQNVLKVMSKPHLIDSNNKSC